MWSSPMSVVKCPHGAEYRGFDPEEAVKIIKQLCEKCRKAA